MTDIKLPEEMIVTQLEEALEERQTPDRRKRPAPLPPEVIRDRRRGDRRSAKKGAKK
jgi:hypothetical protein